MSVQFADDCGVPMESALDEYGCRVVREFLACLLTHHDRIGRGKVKVGQFIKQYMLNQCGHYAGHAEKHNRFWTKDMVLQAINMHDVGGLSWYDVGKELGRTRQAVVNAVDAYKNGRRSFA